MKPTRGNQIFQAVLIVFMILLCIVMLYPFVHMLSISLSTPAESLRTGIHLYPREVSFYAWERVLSRSDIWIGFGNSVFRTVVGTICSIVFMSMGAYPLSRKYLPHRSFFTMLIVFTMFFSGGLIPTYFLIKNLGLIDTRLVYIIPGLISTFSMLILRNFFQAIPEEVEDSAKIDGANDLQILFRIIMPLSLPVLATLSLWSAVGHWNAWFDAVLYIQDPAKQVLTTFLRRVVITGEDVSIFSSDSQSAVLGYAEPIKAATLMFTALPIIVVYPFLQKYFVKGTMVGSLKG
ncbi:carbohydrate ABC transporter permease [Saccharibacillus sp. CPCC 101409]|uniref:carbohydrate ABC transporter permease n=1 Tax=Saccharibacillus sp. CPCC 101409 TaxID=3058041 RepID=UPI002670FA64|nr:carbohydrate ABC transporter permease [Saccharibacillus sp. CPCC 101409]MDO3411927.1 carbohydrate ABC transporter permease [Saccharibacillus sp. CPCC 101409]